MRFWIALIAMPLALLGGCTTLTLSKPDELYLATDYAPRPLTAQPIDLANGRLVACDDSLGVQPSHGTYPNTNVEFRVLPGMTVVVEQATGRLSGASELPTVSRWSWRVPNTANSGCGARIRWTHGDVAIMRALLYGAQVGVGTDAPAGTIGSASAWGMSVQCLLGPKPAPGPDGKDACGIVPSGQGDPMIEGLYQPFARGLGFRLRPNRGPLGGSGLAQQIATLSAPSAADAPATAVEWRKAINCEDPSNWASSANPWPDCRPPFRALVFSEALAEATGVAGDTNMLALPPILRSNVTLLEAADPLFISAPRPLRSLASPAFDLAGGAPGGGGVPVPPGANAGPQRPLAGEGYQGFVSLDVMIPIRIQGQDAPMLVPISTTAATLQTMLGRDVLAIGRLNQWLPERVSVMDKHDCRFARRDRQNQSPIANCALISTKSMRTFLRLDRERGKGRLFVAPADVLIAPGDLVVLR